ncbi:MAG: hemolysin D [Acidocella sp. 20-63-7]|nr:MAG: hemolysin D [Acidocella sp. 20-63-7]HQT47724.1 HlyD family secretion protein [Acidocella sp.]
MSDVAADGVLTSAIRGHLRRKSLVWVGAVLLTLAAAAYGVEYWVSGRFIENTDDAYVGGNVSALAPEVGGLVAEVAVTDDETVQAGQLLIKLDDRPYRAALAKAMADVAAAKAAVANLGAQEVLQQAVIAEARTDIVAADAAMKLAAVNDARYARLAASRAGTVQDAQSASATYAQDKAAAQKARDALTAALARLGVIETQRTQAAAGLAAAQAVADNARLDEQYTEIRAPFTGVVGNRAAHVGEYVAAGAQLLSLVPVTGLWVDANFKEDQLARMRPGQTVRITADIDPEVNITGTVLGLAPASGAVFSVLPAENATGNFTKIVQRVPVRIAFDGSAARLGLLRPGLSVTASVNTK